jgi:hypothetical protein
MPSPAENTIINGLTDADMLEQLIALDLDPVCIPTPDLDKVVTWACDYFLDSRRTQAPSRTELLVRWGSVLEAMGAELEAEDVQLPLITRAVDHLKTQYAYVQFQQIQLDIAKGMAAADPGDYNTMIRTAGLRMLGLADLTAQIKDGYDGYRGLTDSLDRYRYRRDHPEAMRGLGLGLPDVDRFTGCIQPGEVGTIIAPEKAGKSFSGLWAAFKHFQAYLDSVTVLFTLENTVKSAYDRLACQVAQLDYSGYQRGTADPEKIAYADRWLAEHGRDLAERFFVLRPGRDVARTAAAMCQAARAHGADAVIFDQLSHFEVSRRYRSNVEETKRAMDELVFAVSESSGQPLSALLLHQASRDAAEAAKKTGTLGSHGGAGSSAVERNSDLLWGFYRSEDDKRVHEATLELLAFRRGDSGGTWQLHWKPWIGDIRVLPRIGVGHGR